jgi:hypothetical protein
MIYIYNETHAWNVIFMEDLKRGTLHFKSYRIH